jgi:hypothetical protein
VNTFKTKSDATRPGDPITVDKRGRGREWHARVGEEKGRKIVFLISKKEDRLEGIAMQLQN